MREWKRAIFNWRMAASVFCAFFVLIHPLWLDQAWNGMGNQDVLYWITFPMASSGFTPFACIFPALPYGLRFVEEYNSGYLRLAVSRSRKTSYIRGKIVSCALSGGGMMATAFFFVFLICRIGGSSVTESSLSEFYAFSVWKPLAIIWGGTLVLLIKLVLAFVFGAVWGLVPLLMSALYANRYAALVFPFVLYQTAWLFLQDRPINPVYLLRADWAGYQVWYQPVLIQAIVLLFLILLNTVCLRRKLNEI